MGYSEHIPVVLSTKILSASQRNLLLQAGLGLVEYDAITVSPVPFHAPSEIENAIFTSKNAVASVLHENITLNKVYCVGKKTEALLIENGKNVVKTVKNASELGVFISKSTKNQTFYHFSGNLKRPELSDILTKSAIDYRPITVYETRLNTTAFTRDFDAVLFYSPSTVESYTQENALNNGLAICIGPTTGAAAKKHTEAVVIANTTTIESVIAKAAKILVHST